MKRILGESSITKLLQAANRRKSKREKTNLLITQFRALLKGECIKFIKGTIENI